ncbi:MAG: hypothetical protein JNK12_06765 [Acidimicrobiales bacterium]|nr:hypothetical protein [Acidimicrobiales bacterium]
MWLFDLADLFAPLGDFSVRKFGRGLMQGAAEGPGGAFDDPEELPAPAVPEPPPPDLPDTGWDRFAPQERPF